MASRGQKPSYEGRSLHAPGMMRHGPYPGLGPSGHRQLEPLHHPENKLAHQAGEIERLVEENQQLAASQGGLRHELLSAQQELQRLKAHLRSIQTESDIQIRVLLDKIGKMEGTIRVGETVKKEFQQAHVEAQSLVVTRQELTSQIQQASQELQKARDDIKKLPEMHAELDKLRQEHKMLRATFEYEKGRNMEQVEQMQAMEKHLMDMAREMEKLRAEVANTEKRSHVPPPHVPAPYGSGGGYMKSDPLYPPLQGSGHYDGGYGSRSNIPMGIGAPPLPLPGGTHPNSGGWGGGYDVQR